MVESQGLKTPVVFIIFNRPDVTALVLAEIAKVKPEKLFVIADGPRPNKPGEAANCQAARALIETVDWPCQVLKNYSEVNLGCKARIIGGLNWVFSQVEEAIILEDDCLPDPTFFPYCEELLERYRYDDRISCISGANFQFGHSRTPDSYFFSGYAHIWGWASWRRVWQGYDFTLSEWPRLRDKNWLAIRLPNWFARMYWRRLLNETYAGLIDTWAYRFLFNCWVQGKVSIEPNVNLVSNLGYGPEATHTRFRSRLANIPAKAMAFPLSHPQTVNPPDRKANSYEELFVLKVWVPLSLKKLAKTALKALKGKANKRNNNSLPAI